MRATACSRVALLAIALASSACTSTTGEYRRGGVLRTTPVGSNHQDSRKLEITGEDVARLLVNRRTCTQLRTDYANSEVQMTRSPDWTFVGLGALATGAGFALAGVSDGEDSTTLLVLGALVGGPLMIVYGLLNGDESESLVPSNHVTSETTTECSDSVIPVRERLPWTMTVWSSKDSGMTDPLGELSLPPVVASLGEDRLDFERVMALVRGQGIPYQISLSDQSTAGRLSNLPESVYEKYAKVFEPRLSGDPLSKWQNCKVISQSWRETFKCYASQ